MNEDIQKITQIGYQPEASKSLVSPVRLFGVTEQEGQPIFHYMARLAECDGHALAESAVADLNRRSAHENAGFGPADLPTSIFNHEQDELTMLYDHRQLLGIEDQWIYGERCKYNTLAHFLDCARGFQCRLAAGYSATAYAVWRMGYPVR